MTLFPSVLLLPDDSTLSCPCAWPLPLQSDMESPAQGASCDETGQCDKAGQMKFRHSDGAAEGDGVRQTFWKSGGGG